MTNPMRIGSRRGFSLIELMVALVMTVIVAGGLYRVLNSMQRVSGRQTQVSNMQGNLRSGIQLLQGELQELSTNGSPSTDILVASATSIRYRAMRGIGETCAPSTTTELRLPKGLLSSLRDPVATRDGLLVLITDDPDLNEDDWEAVTITNVASGTCADGTASWNLTVSPALSKLETAPSPVRLFEVMEIGQIVDAGQNWLGIRSVSGSEAALIPVVGPLEASGVLFEYFDLNGGAGASATTARTVQVTLRGQGAQAAHTKMDGTVGSVRDSLVVRVQFRNSL